MPLAAIALLLVASQAPLEAPLTVAALRQGDAVELRFELTVPLPEATLAALPSGAELRVVYPVRLRARRSLIWDRRLWRGEITAAVVFDPVIGRYRCQLVLDRVIVATQETELAADALAWLRSPPAVRLDLPPGKRTPELVVRVRAVFSSTTKLLLFPSVDGTDWVEAPVEWEL